MVDNDGDVVMRGGSGEYVPVAHLYDAQEPDLGTGSDEESPPPAPVPKPKKVSAVAVKKTGCKECSCERKERRILEHLEEQRVE